MCNTQTSCPTSVGRPLTILHILARLTRPSQSPGLVPSNFHLFRLMKDGLSEEHLTYNDAVDHLRRRKCIATIGNDVGTGFCSCKLAACICCSFGTSFSVVYLNFYNHQYIMNSIYASPSPFSLSVFIFLLKNQTKFMLDLNSSLHTLFLYPYFFRAIFIYSSIELTVTDLLGEV